MKREDVELLAKLATKEPGTDSMMVRAGLVAALCERWLAVEDAPVGRVKEVGGSLVMIGELSEPFRADARPVRIVPEGGGDGR